MWTPTETPGVGGAPALVAGARGESLVPVLDAATSEGGGPAPRRASPRASAAARAPRGAHLLPVAGSVALHVLVFVASAWMSGRPAPDRPPELAFEVTVPSMASEEHEEAPLPDERDPLEAPPVEPTDPTPEVAVVVETTRSEPPTPEPEETLDELPPDPAVAPAPGFGPPPARVRVRPEPAPAAPAAPPLPTPAALPPPAPSAPASVASRAQSVVERATGLAGNRPPAYPVDARARGEQGTVRLEIEVDEHGAVTSVRILRSSGSGALDEAARAAAQAWRFRPARRDGVAVRAVLERNVTFVLRE